MVFKRNPVQSFLRNIVRWGIFLPAWYFLVWPEFSPYARNITEIFQNNPPAVTMLKGIVFTIILFWASNVIAKMIHILPQWERLVLLRMGKSVGERGPGFFLIPPFIYSIARIIDIRIMTYEVKATKTLTKDNVPIDVTAAIEMEVEDPEKASIKVKDYWKTTEWAAMEALKSAIGMNELRPILSDRETIANSLKKEIDVAVADFGVNVRAVRITDISAPATLIEELAVIARAERSAKAKKIQAEAEVIVAEEIAKASKIMSSESGTMQLRQIQALLEMSKEESSTIIIYPMDSLNGEMISAAAAGNTTKTDRGNITFNKISNVEKT